MGVDLGYIDQKQQEIAAAQAARAVGGVPFWTCPDGRSLIRLLGPWSDKVKSFERPIDMHFGVGPEEQVFTCPGPGCPICAHVAALRATNDPGDAELASRVAKKKRYYSNIVDLADPVWTKKDYDEYKAGSQNQDEPSWRIGQTKVQVFGYGAQIYGQLINLFAALHKDLTDLQVGHDLIITKMGVKLNTKYTVILDPVAKPLQIHGELRYHMLDAISPAKQHADMVSALSGQATAGAIPGGYGSQPAAMAPPPSLPPPAALPPPPQVAVQTVQTGRMQSATPNVANSPKPAAQVQQLMPSPEEAPPCFKDKTTFSTTDAECIGGVTADGQRMDKCPFYQECGEFSGKLSSPPKGRRRASKAESAAAAPVSDADVLEQQMQEALRG
jgi:hypothetical protein